MVVAAKIARGARAGPDPQRGDRATGQEIIGERQRAESEVESHPGQGADGAGGMRREAGSKAAGQQVDQVSRVGSW